MISVATRRGQGLVDIVNNHEVISQKLPRDRPLIYLDYAFTTNIGDQLIVLGTLEFFKRNGANVRYSRNIHNSEPIEKLRVNPDDILVFHGGGNFGDIYPHFQNYREKVIEHYPNNPVVIMPQTVHFSSRDKLARSCERLNKHPDLTLFLRDKVSLDILKPFFGERVILAPDMAHHLWPSLISGLSSSGDAAVTDSLYLFRTDPEKGHVPDNLEVLSDKFTDWDEMISKKFRLRRKAIRWQYKAKTLGLQLMDLDKAYFNLIDKEVRAMCDHLSRYPAWFTSRMHGALLGLLLGKPVFAVDNSYGKLSTYFDAWARWLHPIVLLQTDAQVKRAIDFMADTATASPDIRWQAYCELAEGKL